MIQLTITSLSYAGEGVGRHLGRAVFVPFALPGEIVQVEVIEERKNYARAQLAAIIQAAPERVAPRCPHHFQLAPPPGFESHTLRGACGGCQLQHLDYARQLALKQQTVREQLRRVGRLEGVEVRPTLASPNSYYYRNHMQLALTEAGALGLRAAQSRRVVALRECHQIEPPLAELLPRIQLDAASAELAEEAEPGTVSEPDAPPREPASSGPPSLQGVSLRSGAEGEALVVFEAEAEAPDLEVSLPVSAALLRPDGSSLALAGTDTLTMHVRGRLFRVSAGSFFQVNTGVAEVLVDVVLGALALTGSETVLDLYSGVGLFAAFMAPQARRVIGVEEFEPAVDDAAANLDEFDNIEVYQAPVEAVLGSLPGPFDAAVIDPPRAGCAPRVPEALVAARLPRLVYVSCDPATLARDAARLVAGGYQLDWVQPLDMFPQTYHVESVALFRWVSG